MFSEVLNNFLIKEILVYFVCVKIRYYYFWGETETSADSEIEMLMNSM